MTGRLASGVTFSLQRRLDLADEDPAHACAWRAPACSKPTCSPPTSRCSNGDRAIGAGPAAAARRDRGRHDALCDRQARFSVPPAEGGARDGPRRGRGRRRHDRGRGCTPCASAEAVLVDWARDWSGLARAARRAREDRAAHWRCRSPTPGTTWSGADIDARVAGAWKVPFPNEPGIEEALPIEATTDTASACRCVWSCWCPRWWSMGMERPTGARSTARRRRRARRAGRTDGRHRDDRARGHDARAGRCGCQPGARSGAQPVSSGWRAA